MSFSFILRLKTIGYNTVFIIPWCAASSESLMIGRNLLKSRMCVPRHELESFTIHHAQRDQKSHFFLSSLEQAEERQPLIANTPKSTKHLGGVTQAVSQMAQFHQTPNWVVWNFLFHFYPEFSSGIRIKRAIKYLQTFRTKKQRKQVV